MTSLQPRRMRSLSASRRWWASAVRTSVRLARARAAIPSGVAVVGCRPGRPSRPRRPTMTLPRLPADRAGGHAAAERLRQRDPCRASRLKRFDPRPPAAMHRPVLTSSKMSTTPCLRVYVRGRPRGSPARAGRPPRFIINGLHDQAGRLPALAVELDDAPLQRVGVVEVHREDLVDGGLRDAGARRAATRERRAGPMRSYSTPIDTMTVSWWPW